MKTPSRRALLVSASSGSTGLLTHLRMKYYITSIHCHKIHGLPLVCDVCGTCGNMYKLIIMNYSIAVAYFVSMLGPREQVTFVVVLS